MAYTHARDDIRFKEASKTKVSLLITLSYGSMSGTTTICMLIKRLVDSFEV